MGMVYLAHDTMLERDVALKVMVANIADDPELKQRFEREAKARGEDDPPQRGDGLRPRLPHRQLALHRHGAPEGPGPPEGHAHPAAHGRGAQGLDHRLGAGRPRPRPPAAASSTATSSPRTSSSTRTSSVKIMDFGVARLTSASMTGTGNIVGTADYMSPEQVKGAKVDGRSDVFSVGCMLFELLAGKRPFHSDNLMAIFYKITHEEPNFDLIPAGRAVRRAPAHPEEGPVQEPRRALPDRLRVRDGAAGVPEDPRRHLRHRAARPRGPRGPRGPDEPAPAHDRPRGGGDLHHRGPAPRGHGGPGHGPGTRTPGHRPARTAHDRGHRPRRRSHHRARDRRGAEGTDPGAHQGGRRARTHGRPPVAARAAADAAARSRAVGRQPRPLRGPGRPRHRPRRDRRLHLPEEPAGDATPSTTIAAAPAADHRGYAGAPAQHDPRRPAHRRAAAHLRRSEGQGGGLAPGRAGRLQGRELRPGHGRRAEGPRRKTRATRTPPRSWRTRSRGRRPRAT